MLNRWLRTADRFTLSGRPDSGDDSMAVLPSPPVRRSHSRRGVLIVAVILAADVGFAIWSNRPPTESSIARNRAVQLADAGKLSGAYYYENERRLVVTARDGHKYKVVPYPTDRAELDARFLRDGMAVGGESGSADAPRWQKALFQVFWLPLYPFILFPPIGFLFWIGLAVAATLDLNRMNAQFGSPWKTIDTAWVVGFFVVPMFAVLAWWLLGRRQRLKELERPSRERLPG
ncbi:MAG: hypothetical protein ACRDJM_04460 [Actinomycetota bacterium]